MKSETQREKALTGETQRAGDSAQQCPGGKTVFRVIDRALVAVCSTCGGTGAGNDQGYRSQPGADVATKKDSE